MKGWGEYFRNTLLMCDISHSPETLISSKVVIFLVFKILNGELDVHCEYTKEARALCKL